MEKDNQQTTIFASLYLVLSFLTVQDFAQTDGFDIFSFQPFEFFTKSKLLTRQPFNLSDDDTSFCTANVTNISGGELK